MPFSVNGVVRVAANLRECHPHERLRTSVLIKTSTPNTKLTLQAAKSPIGVLISQTALLVALKVV